VIGCLDYECIRGLKHARELGISYIGGVCHCKLMDDRALRGIMALTQWPVLAIQEPQSPQPATTQLVALLNDCDMPWPRPRSTRAPNLLKRKVNREASRDTPPRDWWITNVKGSPSAQARGRR
jgi:hypothetical protein